MKRFASHYLLIPAVGYMKQQVVEITDEGVVRGVFPLTEEIESVEWMPGVIVLLSESQMEAEKKGEALFPYLFYPFDFTSMQPVDGTRHRLLR